MNRSYPIILFLLALLTSVRTQSSFSMKEAVAFAQENAEEMQIEKLKIADAEWQIKEYKSIGIPKITGNSSYTYYFDIPTQVIPDFISPAVYGVLFNEGLLEKRELDIAGGIPAQFGTENILDASVDLETLILDGSYFVGLRAQKLYRKLVAEQFIASKYSIKEKISMAYLSVLNIEENIKLLEDNIANLEKLYSETNEIYEAGFAEKLDADRLRLSLQNLKTEKENIERVHEVALLVLKQSMGYPMSDTIILKESFDELVNEAKLEDLDIEAFDYLENRPEYTSLKTATELQDMNVKRLKVSYLPTLTGFASYGGQLQRNDLFDSNENDWFKASLVGLRLNVPIFDGFERRAKIQRAKISREQTQLRKSLFERSVELQVNSAYLEYINAKDKVASTRENVNLAQEIYEVTQIKFREGVGSSVEVTQAESELYQSQSNHTAALYELVNASIKLKFALGIL
ncbi:MAG: TolC family protein [Saprospiraceae bacterium]|nr:TolC family protein [Saprospiraceae bacterium]